MNFGEYLEGLALINLAKAEDHRRPFHPSCQTPYMSARNGLFFAVNLNNYHIYNGMAADYRRFQRGVNLETSSALETPPEELNLYRIHGWDGKISFWAASSFGQAELLYRLAEHAKHGVQEYEEHKDGPIREIERCVSREVIFDYAGKHKSVRQLLDENNKPGLVMER